MRLYSSSGIDIAVVDKNFMNSSVSQSIQPNWTPSDGRPGRAHDLQHHGHYARGERDHLRLARQLVRVRFAHFTSGGRFHNGKPEVILGEALAKSLDKKVGDTLELQGSTFTVVGIFQGGTALETGAVILPLDQMQRLTSLQASLRIPCPPQAGSSGRDAGALHEALPGRD